MVAAIGGASLCLFFGYKVTNWVFKTSETELVPRGSLVNDNVVSTLEGVTSTRNENGHKRWEFKAKKIEVEKVPGGSISSVRSSTVTALTDGKLYADDGKFLASFSGRHAEIELQTVSDIPQEIRSQYTVQWQIKLTDTVKLVNAAGDNISTDSLAILNTTSKQTGMKSIRVIWEKGGVFRSGKLGIRVNRADYDPEQGILSCSEGVIASHPQFNVQSQRAYWFSKQGELHLPDRTDGSYGGMPISGVGVIINPEKGTIKGQNCKLRVSPESQNMLHANPFGQLANGLKNGVQ